LEVHRDKGTSFRWRKCEQRSTPRIKESEARFDQYLIWRKFEYKLGGENTENHRHDLRFWRKEVYYRAGQER